MRVILAKDRPRSSSMAGQTSTRRTSCPLSIGWLTSTAWSIYDQRGRGKSADGVEPADVSLATDIEDIERVRQHFRLEAPTLLGHSWGTVLALEYALRHPNRVSRLILMNPAPASSANAALLRKASTTQLGYEIMKEPLPLEAVSKSARPVRRTGRAP
jgi:pimeloyl-ACP methyl ester carboxylesterase